MEDTLIDAFPPLTLFMPHRRPMLLLDALVEYESDRVVCEKTFVDGDPFVKDGAVSSFVSLELFAQAAAAHFGYAGLRSGGAMKSGALLGTRKIDVHVPSFRVGEKLRVHAVQVMALPPAAQFECWIEGEGGARYAEGTISVAISA